MKVIIGADHRGYELKGIIVEWLEKGGYDVVDVGATEYDENDDYVDFACQACESVVDEERAILICGSGHGVDIVANRYKHIRSILGFDKQVVVQGRKHENANVLSIPADWVSREEALTMADFFLTTDFSGEERHVRRLKKLEKIS